MVKPEYLQKRLILRLEEYRRVPLFPDWSFNGVSRIAINNLVVLAKLEKSPDRRELSLSRNGGGLLFSQVVDKCHNINALHPVRDIPVNPPLFQPFNKLLQITDVCADGLFREILA